VARLAMLFRLTISVAPVREFVAFAGERPPLERSVLAHWQWGVLNLSVNGLQNME